MGRSLLSPRQVVASAARTATGNSGTVSAGAAGFSIRTDTMAVFVDVTAVSGTTPTMDLEVEWSPDGGTTWFKGEPADTFTQITAAKKVVKQFKARAGTYRIVWTIAGTTPSFTFSVKEMLG